MNVPTALPFFNGTRKQATRRDGSPVVIFSPRNQLPPFQIQRPNVANDWVKDIFLVDCDGNEYDLERFFENSPQLITNGYTNGIGALQAYDTLTENLNRKDLSSVIKTTTGAGDAGADTAANIVIVSGERFYLEIDLTLNSGIAPKVVMVNAIDYTDQWSNEVLLVNGENNIVFTATDAGNGSLLFYNDTADQTNFSATVRLTRTIRPTVYEFTDVDYIQSNGEKLHYTGNLLDGIKNTGAATAFDTFDLGVGVSISTAVEVAGSAVCEGFPDLDDTAIEGDIYEVHVEAVVINSGATPTINIQNSAEGAQALSAGDNNYTFTIDPGPIGSATLQILTAAATDFETGQISVYKVSGTHDSIVPTGKGLLPKGTFYVKLTDGTNEWFSEWFEIRDIYENLANDFPTESYDTFVYDGTKIVSAVTAAGDAAFSNDLGVIDNDEEIIVVLFLILNSGQLPNIRLTDGSVTSSNIESLVEGINAITLTATKALSTSLFRIGNTGASNFSTSEIWIKRKYSGAFTKLRFGNSADLRGKRSDDQTILYQNSFVQECWLNTILNTPDHNVIDVGDEKDGLFIAEKVVTQYLYKIVDYINRSLFEALIRLPQHDSITIIDEVGNQYTPNIGNIFISAEWSVFDICTFTILFNDGSFVWTENSDNIT